MIELKLSDLTPRHRALLDLDAPAGHRLRAVLIGVLPARFWSDDPHNPTWVVAQETLYGTLYLGGQPPAPVISSIIGERKPYGDVLFGFWPGDEAAALFPPTQYNGLCIDFTDRDPTLDLAPLVAQVPPDCTVHAATPELFPLSEDYAASVAQHGSAERALETMFGFFLMRGGEVLAEAFAGTPVGDVIEVGMTTREAYRRRGYATLLCAHLIHEAERRGYHTYWNANAANTPSVRIARQLGYRTERPYTLWAWFA